MMHEMMPHHPRKRVVNVKDQKWELIHSLHRFPLIDFVDRMMSMPMF